MIWASAIGPTIQIERLAYGFPGRRRADIACSSCKPDLVRRHFGRKCCLTSGTGADGTHRTGAAPVDGAPLQGPRRQCGSATGATEHGPKTWRISNVNDILRRPPASVHLRVRSRVGISYGMAGGDRPATVGFGLFRVTCSRAAGAPGTPRTRRLASVSSLPSSSVGGRQTTSHHRRACSRVWMPSGRAARRSARPPARASSEPRPGPRGKNEGQG